MFLSKYKYWFLVPILVILVVVSVYVMVARVCQSGGVVNGQPKLIIDHDAGADDAMAIFMALLYEQYFNGMGNESFLYGAVMVAAIFNINRYIMWMTQPVRRPQVLALTTTHGNVNEDQSYINSQRILNIAERTEVPIYRGSNFSLVIEVTSDKYFGEDGLGDNYYDEIKYIEAQPLHAAFGIIELTRKYPGEISLVTLGALTNVALALKLDPTLLSRLAHLYVAAGHVYSADHNKPEYNAKQDVEAYYVVARNAYPHKVTILPFSQVSTSNVTKEWRLNVLGAIPTKIMKAQNKFERISIDHTDEWSFLDAITMGAVLDKTIVGDIVYSKNSINLCGESRGININYISPMEDANVKVYNHILDEKYKELLISIFSAELS